MTIKTNLKINLKSEADNHLVPDLRLEHREIYYTTPKDFRSPILDTA